MRLLTLIGCSVSIVGAVLTLIALFLTLKSQPKPPFSTTIFIMINLTSAVFLLDVTLLLSEVDEVISNDAGCNAIAIILHFGVFTCFTWMMNDAIYLYLVVSKVSHTQNGLYSLNLKILAL